MTVYKTIAALPAAGAANLSDLLEIEQVGTSRRATVGQVTASTASTASTANVRAFGALGDDAHDDYPAIQAAINAVKAAPGYGSIVIPPGIYRLISGEIVLDADNLHLIVSPGATIKQMTFGWSTIQIRNANGCSVTGGGKLLNVQPKVEISGAAFDGQSPRQRAAGIYVYECNDTVIDGLTIEGQVTGATFRPANTATTLNENNVLRNVLCKRFDYGFLPQGQRNLVVDNLIGRTTEFSQPTAPPHLVYVTYADLADPMSENLAFSNCVDYDNPFSSSFKINHSRGASLTNMISRKAARGFDLASDYLTVVSPQVHELVDIGDSQQAGIVISGCTCVDITNPIIVLPDNNDVLESITARSDCTDVTIRGGTISAMRVSGSSQGHLRLQGPRTKIIDTSFEGRGVNNHHVAFNSGAVDCTLVRPHVKNATGTAIARVDAGSSNSRIVIDQDLCNFDFVPACVSDTSFLGRVSFEGRLPRSTIAALPATATYNDAEFIVSNSPAKKNPARRDAVDLVWYYPDGTLV